MGIKVTVPNTSSDYVTFGSANTPVAAQIGGYDDGSSNGHLELYTTASGTSTERMRIDSSGNVGIGTSSPSDTLSYGRAVDIQSSAGASVYLRDSDATSEYLSIAYEGGSAKAANFYNSAAGPMKFYTSAAERMRIDSSGNLLVGTTTVTAKTNSFSDTNNCYSATTNTAKTGFYWENNSTTTGNAAYFVSNNKSTNVGRIECSTTTTIYATSSDYRLKENIQPMQGALDFVRKQRPVTYDWKSDGSKGSGYIAHWLQEDGAGNCVTGEKDAVDADGKPVYQGIDTSFMVAPLNAALIELAALVDQLKAELDATKAEIAALKGASV